MREFLGLSETVCPLKIFRANRKKAHLCDKRFNHCLQSKPLEVAGDQFVTAHHGHFSVLLKVNKIHLDHKTLIKIHRVKPYLPPPWSNKRSTSRFHRLEFLGIPLGVVTTISFSGNINIDNFSLGQEFRWQFVNLNMGTIKGFCSKKRRKWTETM